MSIKNERIACTACSFEGYLQYRPITLIYQFNDGTEVESTRIKGWCEHCKNIRPIAFNSQGVWTGFVHDCGGQFKLDPPDPDAPRFSYKPETIYLDQNGLRT